MGSSKSDASATGRATATWPAYSAATRSPRRATSSGSCARCRWTSSAAGWIDPAGRKAAVSDWTEEFLAPSCRPLDRYGDLFPELDESIASFGERFDEARQDRPSALVPVSFGSI